MTLNLQTVLSTVPVTVSSTLYAYFFGPPLTNSEMGSEGRNSEVISPNCTLFESVRFRPLAECISQNPCHHLSRSLAAGRDNDRNGFLPSSDVSSYHVVRMRRTRHVFLCPILPQFPGYVIVVEHEVSLHLNAWRGHESVQYFGLGGHFGHCPYVPLPQFPPRGVEAEFDQTPSGSVIPDRFLV